MGVSEASISLTELAELAKTAGAGLLTPFCRKDLPGILRF